MLEKYCVLNSVRVIGISYINADVRASQVLLKRAITLCIATPAGSSCFFLFDGVHSGLIQGINRPFLVPTSSFHRVPIQDFRDNKR